VTIDAEFNASHIGYGLKGKESVPRRRLAGFVVFALTGIAIFTALGVWQIERRAWKLALIDRVEHRIHASPVAAPGPAAWSSITRSKDEYKVVSVTGRFANDRETLVDATTEQGMGYWIMTPLRSRDGFVVLVNRGFVPADRRDPATRMAGEIDGEATVTGLLRMTEPNGAFLRSNKPNANRWYSRDVNAIAKTQNLTNVAPYFIDADSTPNPGGFPIGGLTVISFYNHHLLYAATWFGMALMLAFALARVVRGAYFTD
jgi:surfeit locus 1 family protein